MKLIEIEYPSNKYLSKPSKNPAIPRFIKREIVVLINSFLLNLKHVFV